MRKFKDIGSPALVLAEQCAEVIRVIKKNNGDWNQIPPSKDKTRLEELKDQMDDLIYQYHKFLEEEDIN
jgi:NTP pyrophosphatase (non-canonical NTP hydrolase)